MGTPIYSVEVIDPFCIIFPASNLLLLRGYWLVKMGCRLVKLLVQCLCMWNKMDLAIFSLFLTIFISFCFAAFAPLWICYVWSKNCENGLLACKNELFACKWVVQCLCVWERKRNKINLTIFSIFVPFLSLFSRFEFATFKAKQAPKLFKMEYRPV